MFINIFMTTLQENLIFVSSCFTTYLTTVDNQVITDRIFQMQQTDLGNIRSNVGGWQSPAMENSNYDNSSVMQLFEKYIVPAAQIVIKSWQLPCTPDKISYWYNVNPKYTYNREHYHGASFISGVYYLKVPEDSGNIYFTRAQTEADRMNFLTKILIDEKLDTDNSRTNTEHWFTPKEGMLILFPGHLSHYVQQNITNDEDDRRVSLSFNFS